MNDGSDRQINILIVDDHPTVRTGLRFMLESQDDFKVVAEASDGAEAVQVAQQTRPDVALIDLRMPTGDDGFVAIEGIRTEHEATRIIVLSTYAKDIDILRAIEKGADGYLLKDAPREELYAAVRGAARGDSPLAPTVAHHLMSHLRDGMSNRLSDREVEILELAARGTSNKRIAAELFITESTVKTHWTRIFEKLGVYDRTAAVVAAIKRGYLTAEA